MKKKYKNRKKTRGLHSAHSRGLDDVIQNDLREDSTVPYEDVECVNEYSYGEGPRLRMRFLSVGAICFLTIRLHARGAVPSWSVFDYGVLDESPNYPGHWPVGASERIAPGPGSRCDEGACARTCSFRRRSTGSACRGTCECYLDLDPCTHDVCGAYCASNSICSNNVCICNVALVPGHQTGWRRLRGPGHATSWLTLSKEGFQPPRGVRPGNLPPEFLMKARRRRPWGRPFYPVR